MTELNSEWVSIYIETPKEGERVMSKIRGKEGYVGGSIYHNGFFETYNDCSNRFEITRWKHDYWKSIPVLEINN